MRTTAEEHKKVLIDDLTTARESILAVIREIPEDQLDTACIGTWSIKDLLAHLIGWDFTNLKAVQEILDGQRPSFFQYYDADWRSYNARLVEMHRIEPFETLMKNATESLKMLTTFLQSLTAKDVLQKKSPKEQGRTITICNLLRSEAEDERKHCAQVEGLRDRILSESAIE